MRAHMHGLPPVAGKPLPPAPRRYQPHVVVTPQPARPWWTAPPFFYHVQPSIAQLAPSFPSPSSLASDRCHPEARPAPRCSAPADPHHLSTQAAPPCWSHLTHQRQVVPAAQQPAPLHACGDAQVGHQRHQPRGVQGGAQQGGAQVPHAAACVLGQARGSRRVNTHAQWRM